MAQVELINVTKNFGATEVIRPTSLTVADKEFLVLVGPSGCGKSTLLRMVAGLEDTTSGEILIGGQKVDHLPPKDRDIAMVFQNYALYPHMNVFDNMGFGLKMRRQKKDEIQKRVTKAAKILEIEHLLKRRPAQLSGGQRQRVAMGRAIVRNPAVFLFDEPLSNLDAKLRVQMRLEIKRLHEQIQTTVIYVTHDQVEAMTLADRIAVINQGVIQQLAPPTTVYDQPANRFVAEFIGSQPMNFIPVKVLHENGRPALFAPGIALHIDGVPGSPLVEKQIHEAIVGIRPEHLHLEPKDDTQSIDATVEVIEPLGANQIVYCKVGEQMIAVTAPENAKVTLSSVIKIFVDAHRIKLFSPMDGARLDR